MSSKKLKDKQNLDKAYCKSIAKSISEVIRFSLNEKFRKQSFELFGVLSTKQTEKEIRKRLKKIVKNKDNDKKDCVKVKPKNEVVKKFQFQVADRENLELQNDLECKKIVSCSRSTGQYVSDRITSSSNICKGKWLQISSEKYKENIKHLQYTKSGHYSQAKFSQRYMDCNELGFHSCNILPNDSVKTSSEVSSMSDESINFLPDHTMTEDNDNYYKVKFKKLIQDDSYKYFKKNFKLQDNLNFT